MCLFGKRIITMWPDIKQANQQEVRKLAIQSCIQSLVHARQCREANCRLPSCQKMKRVVTHTKLCKRKTKGNCPICKQLIALCCWHVKHCRATQCSVPFCSSIKHALAHQYAHANTQCAESATTAANSSSGTRAPAGSEGAFAN